MKKTIAILGILVLTLGYFLLVNLAGNKKLKDENKILSKKTKIVEVKKFIEVPKPYKVFLKPDVEIRYLPDTTRNKYDSILLVGNSILLFNHTITNLAKTDTLTISKRYLQQFPANSKLISFDLTKDNLELQLLRINGMPIAERYTINTNNYKYRYSDGLMSTKRIRNFKILPELGYSYRLINNLHDVDFDLNIKTTNFNYKAGANAFYYPTWNKAGYDFKLTVQYNF